MKKLLIQLDSDKHPSAFDRIVAFDADVDDVLSYSQVVVADVQGIMEGAFFTRGIPDLKNTAVWIGGANVELGEQILAAAQRAFFGPFKVSLMLDSNGCNTTAATAVAKVARQIDLRGRRALVIAPGPVGLRTAMLLAREGCSVMACPIPPELFGPRYDAERVRRRVAKLREQATAFNQRLHQSEPEARGSLEIAETPDLAALERNLEGVEIVAAAGPAGIQVLPRALWAAHPTLRLLIDFNATDPLGIEGTKATDDFAERDGKQVLGALAVGNPKMKVHKACIRRLFERNDLVLDVEGVYAIAKELL